MTCITGVLLLALNGIHKNQSVEIMMTSYNPKGSINLFSISYSKAEEEDT